MMSVMSAETVSAVRMMKPLPVLAELAVCSEEMVVSWPVSCAALSKASLTWSSVMSPVSVIWMEVPPENSVPRVTGEPVIAKLAMRPARESTMRMPERMKPFFQSPTKLKWRCGRRFAMTTSPPWR